MYGNATPRQQQQHKQQQVNQDRHEEQAQSLSASAPPSSFATIPNNSTSDMVAQYMQRLWASIQHQSQQPQQTVVEEPLECVLTEQPQETAAKKGQC